MSSADSVRLRFFSVIQFWKNASTNWVVSVVNKFVVLLFFLSVILLIWKSTSLPQQIPLWYTQPWGEDQLANPWWLIMFPVSSLAVYLINIVISALLCKKHLIFLQLLFAASLLVSILAFIDLVKILSLVT